MVQLLMGKRKEHWQCHPEDKPRDIAPLLAASVEAGHKAVIALLLKEVSERPGLH
jgi:hypothetical protein